MCNDAYLTTMWQQTTELLPSFNKEFSQDECSPDNGFPGSRITGGPHFPCCLFLHHLNDSIFFHVEYRIHPEKYIKQIFTNRF